jgi:hypothetical protein
MGRRSLHIGKALCMVFQLQLIPTVVWVIIRVSRVLKLPWGLRLHSPV